MPAISSLKNLNPSYKNNSTTETVLAFDCPTCQAHRIEVPVTGPKAGEVAGKTLNTMTIFPVVKNPTHSTQFYVKGGAIIDA
jgi:hypothetical protein